ncbi:uncharacterized protein BO95DRAFT_192132 [Aspergillus brunneoviolaceus CBS 621.78]|uniref:Uncharacterized protein n=1 Tax=Aspergillus brunneoviolaceus CBS 621.78 TaxID=1450534 RepID=A0ACD1G3S6_9EURO|nr:hypothetical protein BO95DRAFT_192132 [Aspergillus brunneoviolaceus CBS 621.78]RAH43918.1 hypothetical protein BO95DRAFT_192132 [Aspergillus brunneoviolaceus CBS 621.78]
MALTYLDMIILIASIPAFALLILAGARLGRHCALRMFARDDRQYVSLPVANVRIAYTPKNEDELHHVMEMLCHPDLGMPSLSDRMSRHHLHEC